MVHGKAKLTPAGRLLLVERIDGLGWPVAHAAAMAGVSRCTAYKWLARWRAEGLAGLEDRSSRPRSCPRQTPAAVEARIVELRRELRRGPHLLGGRLGLACRRFTQCWLVTASRGCRDSTGRPACRSVTNGPGPASSSTST